MKRKRRKKVPGHEGGEGGGGTGLDTGGGSEGDESDTDSEQGKMTQMCEDVEDKVVEKAGQVVEKAGQAAEKEGQVVGKAGQVVEEARFKLLGVPLPGWLRRRGGRAHEGAEAGGADGVAHGTHDDKDPLQMGADQDFEGSVAPPLDVANMSPLEPADAAPQEATAEKQPPAPRPKRPSLYHLSNDYGLTFAIISAVSIIAKYAAQLRVCQRDGALDYLTGPEWQGHRRYPLTSLTNRRISWGLLIYSDLVLRPLPRRRTWRMLIAAL